MKTLFIDTTTKDLIVAIVTDDGVIDLSEHDVGTRHSERLCGAVAELLAKANLTFDQLDAYACSVGPGSFTGIRIGVSTTKGYVVACPKPLIAVNNLQAIASSVANGNKQCAFIDAGNGYYYANYTDGVAPCLVPYDFAETHPDVPLCALASQYMDGLCAIVRNKFAAKQFDDDLVPVYIRRSQAEDNLAKKQTAENGANNG